MFLLTRWKVRGRENIPEKGPLLIIANHINLADPPIIGLSVGRKVRFIAKEELFRSRFSSYFMRNFGAFPIYRGRLGRIAFNHAQQSLAQGLALLMFPEGRRSHNIQLQSAFSGSVLIASRCGTPILPVGITGTENIRGVAWWLHRPQITVNIGSPFYLPHVNGKLVKEERVRLTSSMMERIAELLPPEYQGSYARGTST